MQEREALIEKLEAQMREWSARFAELKRRVGRAGAARRAEYAKQIAALQAHGDQAAERLHKLRGAGEHAWEELREATEKAWEEMAVGLEGAMFRLRPRSAAAAAKVGDLMSRDVSSCGADDPLNAAARIFWERDCGCAPVIDAEARVVGIVTDRDVCMAAYFRNRPLTEIRVAEVMSKDVAVCRAEDPLPAAAAAMSRRQVRRLPVIDADRRLIGVLSLNDVARGAARARSARRAVKAEEVCETLLAIGERRGAQSASTAASSRRVGGVRK